MTFTAESIATFQTIFEERKQRIRSFNGCEHLELWQDAHNPCIFFTYSIWQNEKDLDHYRFSEFFKETWSLTRALFASKAQAWSVQRKATA
jgi:hypothetical protein